MMGTVHRKEMEKKAQSAVDPGVFEQLTSYREGRCRLYLSLVYMALFTLVYWIVGPVILRFKDGKRVNLIDSWVPLDTDYDLGWVIMYVLQLTHITTAMIAVHIYDTVMLCAIEIYHLQIEYLKAMVSTIRYNENSKSPKSLNFCIRFHQDVIRLGEELNTVLKFLLFSQCLIATMIICLSVFEVFKLREGSSIAVLFLAGCEVYELLLYGWICHEVEEENVQLIRSAFESNWIDATISDQKSLCLFMEMCMRPRTFGIVITLNMGTFVAVMKSAFSYYQFLETVTT